MKIDHLYEAARTSRRRHRLHGTTLAIAAALTVAASAPAQAQVARIETVVVDCARRLGPADQVRDFLAAGGGLEAVAGDADHPLVQAWRDLGMRRITYEKIHIETPEEIPFLTVTRSPAGDIDIDFSAWDEHLRNAVENLGSTPFLHLGAIPQALSSHPEADNYWAYQPQSLDEWQSFVARIVEHTVNVLGLVGLSYGVNGEPDHPDTWKGSGSGDPNQTLREHIELYAATYRGVKSADPAAQVGGPATMSWQASRYTTDPPFVLADWIRALAQYNQEQTSDPAVTLDFVAWQDYSWVSDQISDGADAVSGFLEENGFDPATPKMIGDSGWGSWSSDYFDGTLEPHQRASHLLHNVIREFRDPRARKFLAGILYYCFFFREDWVTPGFEAEMETLRRVALVICRLDGGYDRTPIYAGFEMVAAMTRGDIVQTIAPAALAAMATRDDLADSVAATVNNHHAETFQTELVLRNLPRTDGLVYVRLQRIDSAHSVAGQGLEAPSSEALRVSDGMLRLPLTLEAYGSVQVSVRPIRIFAQDFTPDLLP
ncbi:MAG: hypothetical protein HYV63_07130 [Candidatus Schekmanbacteria bacterium]|nr:hypothetical protein [Candidatus Schekmanbacteria bacterium]